MKKRIFNLLLLLTVNFVFLSCTKDIDFNQVNDFEVSPVIESSLIFLDEPANQFLEDGVEISTVQDSVLVNIFKDDFISEHLVKAEFVFETINSINRGVELRIDFLTDSNIQLHSFSFAVEPSTNNTPIMFNYTEVFEGSTLANFLETEKLLFTLSLQQGPAINDDTPGNIELKSKGVFFFNIDNTL
ncbi:hypothetical protein [Seonamhaeicola aphaedonensis]|uniref:Uncharacterized protein n=1 Tax=Seonamhaeicola aphaedonensis TaxID=1461338 RepID=A0A3D9HKV3_9FLAO|nr:hypothetical protein [Seonamhaeicola aphaedonensis]RED50045.1 hypothetical protein DFQ02_10165 [Seonamhaeicola aphaedonensis]